MSDPATTRAVETRPPALSELAGHLLLAFTAVMWGASFVGTKLVVDTIPPLTLGFLRAALATLLLVGCVRLARQRLAVPWAEWRWLAEAPKTSGMGGNGKGGGLSPWDVCHLTQGKEPLPCR